MSSANVSKRPMTAGRAKKIAKNTLVHIILAILVVIWLFPIFWIIMTSLRGEGGAYTSYFFPKELTFNNYKRLFTETTLLNFPRAFMNTLIISIFSCLISTTFVLSVSYCMSRLRFKMRSILYFKSSWTDRGRWASYRSDSDLFSRIWCWILYRKGIL